MSMMEGNLLVSTETTRTHSETPAAFDADDTDLDRRWSLIRAALSVSRPLGALSAIFALSALAGYFGSIETLYRPITGGPATNPLTATIFFLLGGGVAIGRRGKGMWIQRIFGIAGVILTASVLFDARTGYSIETYFTLFQEQVQQDLSQGKSNNIGVNSAFFLMLISIALTFNSFQKINVAQAAAFVAGAIPMISLVGYAYGIESFYGQMSLVTATAGVALATASLSMTAQHGALRAVLSPYIGGSIARVQVLLGVLVPFAVGFLIIKTLVSSGEGDFLGVYVVAVSWFIIILVCASALVQERVDSKRRVAEKKLLFVAMNDPLTLLPNRRKFFDVGEREMTRRRRTGADVSVLMVDIDHFKKVNDTAGHAKGDEVLRVFANILRDSLRAIDLPGRLGGEEFAVLLADTSISGAQRVAEKIRLNIEAMPIEGWTDVYGPITVSIGCASAEEDRTLAEMLSAADKALYKAKEQGRNRVIVSA
jgi:diguanylate cyclase (GGDEF)-like protein